MLWTLVMFFFSLPFFVFPYVLFGLFVWSLCFRDDVVVCRRKKVKN